MTKLRVTSDPTGIEVKSKQLWCQCEGICWLLASCYNDKYACLSECVYMFVVLLCVCVCVCACKRLKRFGKYDVISSPSEETRGGGSQSGLRRATVCEALEECACMLACVCVRVCVLHMWEIPLALPISTHYSHLSHLSNCQLLRKTVTSSPSIIPHWTQTSPMNSCSASTCLFFSAPVFRWGGLAVSYKLGVQQPGVSKPRITFPSLF